MQTGETSAPSVRAASIEGFADLVRRLGHEPAPLLADAGLDMRVLIEPDLRIEASKLLRLLEIAAVETGADDFGLRLAQMHGLSNLGPIGILAREERNAGDALRTLIEYLYLHNSMTRFRIDTQGEPAVIALFLKSDQPGPMRQTTDLAVGATVGILRALIGKHWNPEFVQLHYAEPERKATHVQMYRCPIEFGAPHDAIHVLGRDLNAPLESSSPEFQRQARQWVESLAERAKSDSDFSDDVRNLIVMLLSSGRCNADRLAGFYGVHRRTIHRRLAQSGQSFNSLVNEVRRDLAERRVGDERLSLGEISHALGFEQQSSFSRWFQQEFGASAAAWRRAARREAVP